MKKLCLAALLCSFALGKLSAQTPDPIEGKWYGTAGFPQDRVDMGFEFKRDEKGNLEIFCYQPVLNFYPLEMGFLTREGDKYVNKDNAISLAFKDGGFEGTFYPLNAPISLKRVDKLPEEAPIPDLPRGPGPKWIAKLGATIYAPAAVREGIAYVGTTGGVFHAVRVADGGFAWTFVAGRPIHGEALATDDSVFFVCDNGYLFKLDRKTGKEVWRYDLGDERVSRPLFHQVLDKLGIGEFDMDVHAPKPLLADGVLYVGSGDGSFHAVDAAKGNRIWRFDNAAAYKNEAVPWNSQASSKNRTDAILDGPQVIFASFDHRVYALDRKTGKEVWNKDTRAEITSSPALIGEKLIVGNRGGILAALNPKDGQVAWRMLFWGSAIESTAIPAGNGLFFIGASDLRRVSLIDSKDGRVLWRTDLYGVPWGRPAANDRFVYEGAYGWRPYDMRHFGSFCAIDRATGKLAWRWPWPPCDEALLTGFVASPAVAGDTVVIGGLDGDLYGFPAQ